MKHFPLYSKTKVEYPLSHFYSIQISLVIASAINQEKEIKSINIRKHPDGMTI